ncbi:hypothetical protein HK104_009552 [Borealophlyctis nickersoniae]|nr:hypothetical protein HK104_009552 [Borealophlyctis nickersoniae]
MDSQPQSTNIPAALAMLLYKVVTSPILHVALGTVCAAALTALMWNVWNVHRIKVAQAKFEALGPRRRIITDRTPAAATTPAKVRPLVTDRRPEQSPLPHASTASRSGYSTPSRRPQGVSTTSGLASGFSTPVRRPAERPVEWTPAPSSSSRQPLHYVDNVDIRALHMRAEAQNRLPPPKPLLPERGSVFQAVDTPEVVMDEPEPIVEDAADVQMTPVPTPMSSRKRLFIYDEETYEQKRSAARKLEGAPTPASKRLRRDADANYTPRTDVDDIPPSSGSRLVARRQINGTRRKRAQVSQVKKVAAVSVHQLARAEQRPLGKRKASYGLDDEDEEELTWEAGWITPQNRHIKRTKLDEEDLAPVPTLGATPKPGKHSDMEADAQQEENIAQEVCCAASLFQLTLQSRLIPAAFFKITTPSTPTKRGPPSQVITSPPVTTPSGRVKISSARKRREFNFGRSQIAKKLSQKEAAESVMDLLKAASTSADKDGKKTEIKADVSTTLAGTSQASASAPPLEEKADKVVTSQPPSETSGYSAPVTTGGATDKVPSAAPSTFSALQPAKPEVSRTAASIGGASSSPASAGTTANADAERAKPTLATTAAPSTVVIAPSARIAPVLSTPSFATLGSGSSFSFGGQPAAAPKLAGSSETSSAPVAAVGTPTVSFIVQPQSTKPADVSATASAPSTSMPGAGTASGFSFGGVPQSTKSPADASATSSAPLFSFPTVKPTGSLSFGSDSQAIKPAMGSGISTAPLVFGAAVGTPPTSIPAGQPQSMKPADASATASAPSTSISAAGSAPAFQLGAQSQGTEPRNTVATSSAVTTASSTAAATSFPSFGSPAPSAGTGVSAALPPAFSFNAASVTTTAPSSTAPSVTAVQQTPIISQPPSSTFNFKPPAAVAAATPAPPTTSTGFNFGSSAVAGQPTVPSAFGGTGAPQQSNFAFGAASAPTSSGPGATVASTPASSAPFAFGSTSAAPAGSSFGAPGFSFGGASGFAAAAQPPSSQSGFAPVFGSSSSTVPASQPSAVPSFGSTSSTGSFNFGQSTSAPAFGFGATGTSTAPSTPAFSGSSTQQPGSSVPAFGASTFGASSFGTPSSGFGFGQSAPATGASTSFNFGAQGGGQQQPSVFGFGGGGSSAFGQQPGQQSGFGAPSSPGAFQFGSSAGGPAAAMPVFSQGADTTARTTQGGVASVGGAPRKVKPLPKRVPRKLAPG